MATQKAQEQHAFLNSNSANSQERNKIQGLPGVPLAMAVEMGGWRGEESLCWGCRDLIKGLKFRWSKRVANLGDRMPSPSALVLTIAHYYVSVFLLMSLLASVLISSSSESINLGCVECHPLETKMGCFQNILSSQVYTQPQAQQLHSWGVQSEATALSLRLANCFSMIQIDD